jgi:hypothetical protein
METIQSKIVNTGSTVVEIIDDGHKPGKTDAPTQLIYQTKSFSNFVLVKDNVLNDLWLSRAYEYSKSTSSNAWGEYISTSEILNYDNITTSELELLYKSHPQKAIALVATKALLFDRSRLPVDDIISQVDGRLTVRL